jgi:hypothetical protein
MFSSILSHPGSVSFGLLLCLILGIASWLLLKRGGAKKLVKLGEIDTEYGMSISQLQELPQSPLARLSPTAKLSQWELAKAVESHCNEIFQTLLSGDTVNIVIEGVTSHVTAADIVYRFSDHALELYRRGEAQIAVHEGTGKYLPIMQDRSGTIIEQAKGTISMAPKLAQVFSLVVSAAHLIAGCDLSKRVKRIQTSVDLLVAGRQIDKESSLERYFLKARGELSRPLTNVSLGRLREIRYSLAQLRAGWRREIAGALAPSDKLARRKWWNVTTWVSNKKLENRILEEAPAVGLKLEATGAALMIDTMVAFSTGTLDELRSNVLAREGAEWRELAQRAQSVIERFHGKRKTSCTQIADGIAGYLAVVDSVRAEPHASTRERLASNALERPGSALRGN